MAAAAATTMDVWAELKADHTPISEERAPQQEILLAEHARKHVVKTSRARLGLKELPTEGSVESLANVLMTELSRKYDG
jgi:hypothetical protein